MATERPPIFPGYVPVAPYYMDEDDPEWDDETEMENRALYHDQFDDEGDGGQVAEWPPLYDLVAPRPGGFRRWHGDANAPGFEGQPPPGTWVMKRQDAPARCPVVRADLDALLALAREMATEINTQNAGTPSADEAARYMATTIARVAAQVPA